MTPFEYSGSICCASQSPSCADDNGNECKGLSLSNSMVGPDRRGILTSAPGGDLSESRKARTRNRAFRGSRQATHQLRGLTISTRRPRLKGSPHPFAYFRPLFLTELEHAVDMTY